MRKHFSEAEHVAIGELLKRVRVDLLNVAMAVQDAYGKKVSKPFFTVADKLTGLRWDLECRLSQELNGDQVEGRHLFEVYFGATGNEYFGTDGAARFRADLIKEGEGEVKQ
jgi:hypothetical protein